MRHGKKHSIKVLVEERIEPDHRFFEMFSAKKNLVERLGVLCLDLNAQTSGMLPMAPRKTKGVIVAALAISISPFGEAFMPGDIIYTFNNTTPQECVGKPRTEPCTPRWFEI